MVKSKYYYGTINIKHLRRVGNLRGCDPGKLFSNQVKQEMKNLKSTEPIYLEGKHGWYADIYEGEKSSVETDICTVWGATEEELNYRVTMIKKAYEMQEALKGIYSIRELLFYPNDTKQGHLGEAIAVSEALKKIETLIKEIKS